MRTAGDSRKSLYRRMPRTAKHGFDQFKQSVKMCALRVTPERSRAFRRRCRKYMLAYLKLCTTTDERVPSVEHTAIEAAARGVERSELGPKRRRVSMLVPADFKLKDTDLEMAYLKMTLVASKRSGQTVDPSLESEVDMVITQQTQSKHRSAGEMDVTFVNEACVEKEGEAQPQQQLL